MQKYALLQEELDGMSKRDAVDHLHHQYPHKAREWFNRNLAYIMALDPRGLSEVLTYGDPTGNRAVRHVMEETA